MGIYSPYAVAESDSPKWKPGENLAAAAFVGISIFLVIDINVGIWRVFKKRQGLYYWSMKLGTIACFTDALGVILKFLVPDSGRIWGLYTALLLVGWTGYAPAQLLVLYSRLHLVNDSHRMQHLVLIMIILTLLFLILPTWIVVWPAYDTDPKVSSVWSPRDAIVERYNQMGFTLIECVLSGVYIWSLIGLLNLKSSVRQRRVMLDLIYVNAIIVSMDLVVVILLYLNQTGISHPIQTFSYALKLKLEFVVLNQLMAVAARGLQKQNFEERRYHHSSVEDAFAAECREWDEKTSVAPSKEIRRSPQEVSKVIPHRESIQITVPPRILSRQQQNQSASISEDEATISRPQETLTPPSNEDEVYDHTALAENLFGSEQELQFDKFLEDGRASKGQERSGIRERPSQTFSGETLRPLESTAREGSPHLSPRRVKEMKKQALRSIRRPFRHIGQDHDRHDSSNKRKSRLQATMRRRVPKNGKDSNEEDEEEEIGLHMWENRRGSLIMEVPWFKSKVEEV